MTDDTTADAERSTDAGPSADLPLEPGDADNSSSTNTNRTGGEQYGGGLSSSAAGSAAATTPASVLSPSSAPSLSPAQPGSPAAAAESLSAPAEEGLTLIIGDDNFTFTSCFLESRHYSPGSGPVELASCLSEDKIPNDFRPNYLALTAQGITIHFGINPAQLRNHFFHNQYSRIIFILPGIAFSGFPSFLDKQRDPLFRLRLHIYAFGFLKSSKNALRPNAVIQFLWPRQSERNELSPAVPWHSIEIGKIGPFCEVFRSVDGDETLDASAFHDWHPLIHNEPQTTFPSYLHDSVFYTWRITPPPSEKLTAASGEGSGCSDGPSTAASGPTRSSAAAAEDKDSNLLFVPPELWNFPVETLPHVNELFKFEMKTHDDGVMVVSKPTLKFDPRFRSDGAPAKNPFAKGGGQASARGPRRPRGQMMFVPRPFACPPPPPPPDCPMGAGLLPGGLAGGGLVANPYGYGDPMASMVHAVEEPPRWAVHHHRIPWDMDERALVADGAVLDAAGAPSHAAVHYGAAGHDSLMGAVAGRGKRSRLDDDPRYLADPQRYHELGLPYANAHFGKDMVSQQHPAYFKAANDGIAAMEAAHEDVLLYESLEQNQYDYGGSAVAAGYDGAASAPSLGDYSRRGTAVQRSPLGTAGHSHLAESCRSLGAQEELADSMRKQGYIVARTPQEQYVITGTACPADPTMLLQDPTVLDEPTAPPYAEYEHLYRHHHHHPPQQPQHEPHQHHHHHGHHETSHHHDHLHDEPEHSYRHHHPHSLSAHTQLPQHHRAGSRGRASKSGYNSNNTSAAGDGGSPVPPSKDFLRSADRAYHQRHHAHHSHHYHGVCSLPSSGCRDASPAPPGMNDKPSSTRKPGAAVEDDDRVAGCYVSSASRGPPSPILSRERPDEAVYERRRERGCSLGSYDGFPSPSTPPPPQQQQNVMLPRRQPHAPLREKPAYPMRISARRPRPDMSPPRGRSSVSPDVSYRSKVLVRDAPSRRKDRSSSSIRDPPHHHGRHQHQRYGEHNWPYRRDMPSSPENRELSRRAPLPPRDSNHRSTVAPPDDYHMRRSSPPQPLPPLRAAGDRYYVHPGVEGIHPRKITLISNQGHRGLPPHDGGYRPRSREMFVCHRRSTSSERFALRPRRSGGGVS